MSKIIFSEHAIQKLRERGIPYDKVFKVLRGSSKTYFDILTGNYIRVGERVKRCHWLIVVFKYIAGDIKIVTVIDVKDINRIVGKRISRGRWVETR